VVHRRQPSTFTASVDGEVLGVFRTPMLSSARILLERGASPDDQLTMSHAGSATVAMRSTVGVAAKLTVKEDNSGPRFRPYDGAESRPTGSPAVVQGSEATHLPADETAAPESSHPKVSA
jgi:hypothetical protein